MNPEKPIKISDFLSKTEFYQYLHQQLKALLEDETDSIVIMAQATALIHHSLNWHWTGFYRVLENELRLGPYQGPPACTRIGFGKGVCGTCWKIQDLIYVPDVNAFPGHIACSSFSRSELVIPIFDLKKQVSAVLDIDSVHLNGFDACDQEGIKNLASLLNARL